jgi:glycosyltransferase involved in cell wall biosynthesis
MSSMQPAVSFSSSLAPDTIALPWVTASVPSAGNRSEAIVESTIPAITHRVLHLVNGQHFAGAERVQSHLGRCLPSYGVQADFACLKPGRFADAVDEANGAWGTAFRYPMSNRFDLRVVSPIIKQLHQGKYNVLHAHTPRTAMIAAIASKRTGVPWIYHVHSPAARDSSKPLTNWFNANIERWSLKNCRHLITVSDSLRRELIAGGMKEASVTVVRNGVPGIRYARKSVPVVGGTWTFGMVALMRPRKGLEVALDAIAMLRQRGFDAKLRCIGPYETDDYRRKIEAQIDSLSIRLHVEQMGFKSDVPLALAKLDGMLLPSLFGEGLPMVVLEAMASALPVIATKVEGTPEAIRDGIDGLLAEPGSAESLAEKMQALMDGSVDWDRLATSACRRHSDMFSDYAMSEGVAQVYKQVVPVKHE